MAKKSNITQSPMAGSGIRALFKMKKGHKVEAKYRLKYFLMIIFSLSIEPLRWLERRKLKKQLKSFQFKEDPVFILGHWRSGTTYLHNVLCQDASFGFISTYQGIYPETMFVGNRIIKSIMNVAMPKRRPSDNMELNPDFPQEEEFAMGNTTALSYYNFWFFPKSWRTFYKKYIAFDGASKKEINAWKKGYLNLAKKALISQNKDRFISKNPPNTGRIKLILEMFPNAKFIFIHREPMETYMSTKSFVKKTMELPKLQDLSDADLKSNIHWTYFKLMNTYLKTKSLIPKENLIEIRFADFEKAPLAHLKMIYNHLQIPGFDAAEQNFKKYIKSKSSFKKNDYLIPEKIQSEIAQVWQFAFLEWGYELPKNEVLNSKTVNV